MNTARKVVQTVANDERPPIECENCGERFCYCEKFFEDWIETRDYEEMNREDNRRMEFISF